MINMKRSAQAALGFAIMAGFGFAGPSPAQVVETPEIARKLVALGTELGPELIGGTQKLYGPLHAQENDEGLTVSRDLAYGPHDRNKLDVYAPKDADGTQPILVFVHGGGFVRGDKGGAQNIGRWFARHGIVAITINYRFAPENTWPSGAQDLKLVMDWIAGHAEELNGDITKVVLSGNSAGAMHVADYVFREEQQRTDDGVVGAVIVSPPTADLTAREIDPARDALYYGPQGDRAAQSVVNAVEGRELPVMIAYGQFEPAVIIDQTRLLIDGLAARDKRLPLVVGVPGHNHISIVEHIGTADESLAREMLDFVRYLALPPS